MYWKFVYNVLVFCLFYLSCVGLFNGICILFELGFFIVCDILVLMFYVLILSLFFEWDV